MAYSQNINVQSRISDDHDEGKLEEMLSNIFHEELSTATGKTIRALNSEMFSAMSGSRIGHPVTRSKTTYLD